MGGQRASFPRPKRVRARLITLGLILVVGLVSSLWWFPGWGGLVAAHWRGSSEIVVIDSTLANQAPWQQGLLADHQTVVVPPDQGLAAVTQALANYQDVRAVHLVTHGRPGGLVLGGEELRLDNLQQWNDELKQWRSFLRPGADLLIYGCEVAQGSEGQQFLATVQVLTQADVAASTTLTGPAALGGDWVLETALGQIQTSLPWPTATLSTLPRVLKQITLTSTADSGPGTLRTAIHQANQTPEDDLISLSAISGTIALASPLPPIASNLFLVGNGDDTLSGQGKHRVLRVNGGDVTIRDLTVANGLAAGDDGLQGAGGSAGMGGGLLINDGKVTLTNVRFVDNQAVGGRGLPRQATQDTAIRLEKQRYTLNRGAIAGVNGIGIHQADALPVTPKGVTIDTVDDRFRANRGAIAGANGIGIGGIGTIAFAGGGGFGGLGNAGNGGNGGDGGPEGGNGGNGGDGGNGGVGMFGGSGPMGDLGTLGVATFSGGGGLGGVGNAGNGGSGGDAQTPTANGGNGGSGGNGGNGGFGGGGGAGGWGGAGGYFGLPGEPGNPGMGGLGGGDGSVGLGGGGGGLGGAIFLRAGRLILHNTVFEHNEAIPGDGANPGQGKGGAIFVPPPEATAHGRITPQVRALGAMPTFIDNQATTTDESATDNNNWYGTITLSAGAQ